LESISSMNTCHFVGNLTRNPETRALPSGNSVTNFGMAINKRIKNKDTGEWSEKPTFLDFVAWGNCGETIGKYCEKGSKLVVTAEAEKEEWTDKTTEQKRSRIVFKVTGFEFVGGGKRKENAGNEPEPVAAGENVGDDGGIPF
jgi:single-strand DNA-binding protein